MQAKILVINGPNLNTLGTREPDIYGNTTLAEIEAGIRSVLGEEQIEAEFYQSNHEGDLIDKLQSAGAQSDLVIVNAGALTHYGIALYDALKAAGLPVIEVHMSNIYAREPFRSQSLLSPLAVGGIFGFGPSSYYLAARAAIDYLGRTKDR
ncbi:MAG TPA: type II 3-dehydroquinate dehydratase [Syntrophomonas sp.]|jgi:3-dehydroquinate dehydratase-2|nr:type II 3-dehydroquinate dehydratase [Syntrophomonas sp.]